MEAKTKKRIAIVMGGFSNEHDISIKSGNAVYEHLPKERYACYRILILERGWFYLDDDNREHPVNKDDFSLHLEGEKLNFHVVFNAIHGTPGEDGLLQAYFELLGLPQTSCNFYQAALTFNKRDFLSSLKPYGIRCATSYYINKGDAVDQEAIVQKVGLPCFVKANKSGSSLGISKVYKKEALAKAVESAFEHDDEVLVEQYLDGVEVSVGVVRYQGQTKVLPITEIVTETDFFDYEAKYLGKSTEITPARLSPLQEEKVSAVALKIYEILKMKGFSRSEFIFVGNEPYLLEMNTTPGLTSESILPQQAKAAGIPFAALLENAILEAMS
ncbi:D-alanine--D-alanine ligase [Maribacter sp. 2307ULW6-5]|uniref:D-alanine--D-alanine ligase n=1 Tax=Maribacter sp. 2307ULW6-5 TaxID=3386275 RepID=UPI0039BCC7F8